VQGSKVPLKVGGESKRIRCKAELVRITSQISVGIAPPYLQVSRESESELLLSDSSVGLKLSGAKTIQVECVCSTHGNFLINRCCESDRRRLVR